MATQSNFGFTVEVHSTDPSRIVTLLSPAGGIMHADLKGPQGGIHQAWPSRWESGPVSVDVNRNFSPNADHPIPADVLNNKARLKQAGVSISNFTPTEWIVHVDAIEERANVKVAASTDDFGKPASPPVFTPDRAAHYRAAGGARSGREPRPAPPGRSWSSMPTSASSRR